MQMVRRVREGLRRGCPRYRAVRDPEPFWPKCWSVCDDSFFVRMAFSLKVVPEFELDAQVLVTVMALLFSTIAAFWRMCGCSRRPQPPAPAQELEEEDDEEAPPIMLHKDDYLYVIGDGRKVHLSRSCSSPKSGGYKTMRLCQHCIRIYRLEHGEFYQGDVLPR